GLCGTVVLSGFADGSVQGFYQGADGLLTPAGSRFQPFPGFAGAIRSVVADFNGDGVLDAAFGTGSGTAAQVRVIDGTTGGDLLVGAGVGGGPRVAVYDGTSLLGGSPGHLVPDFFALDPALRSGVFVTSADLDGDGFADVLYSTGDTGGPRVRVVGGAVLTG